MKKETQARVVGIVIKYFTNIFNNWYKYKDRPKKAPRLRNKDGSFTFDIGDKDA